MEDEGNGSKKSATIWTGRSKFLHPASSQASFTVTFPQMLKQSRFRERSGKIQENPLPPKCTNAPQYCEETGGETYFPMPCSGVLWSPEDKKNPPLETIKLSGNFTHLCISSRFKGERLFHSGSTLMLLLI